MTDDRADILASVLRMRDRQFADLFTLWVGLAAECSPDEVRTALSKVFDLSAVEQVAKQAMMVATAAQVKAGEAAMRIEKLTREVEEVERLLHLRLDKAAKLLAEPPKPAANGAVTTNQGVKR